MFVKVFCNSFSSDIVLRANSLLFSASILIAFNLSDTSSLLIADNSCKFAFLSSNKAASLALCSEPNPVNLASTATISVFNAKS